MDENRSQLTPGSVTWTRYNAQGALIYGPKQLAVSSAIYTQRIVTKPERRPKPVGWLFPTSYSFEQSEQHYPVGRVTDKQPSYTDKYSGDISGYLSRSGVNLCPGGNTSKGRPYPNLGHVSLAESKARNALLRHGKEREGTFNVGVAWGERKELAMLLNATASSALETIQDLRKGNLKKAFRDLFPNGSRKDWALLKGTPYHQWYRQRLKRAARPLTPQALASGYLALQNGWKPALADLHNAAEALAFRNTLADWVITGKGYYKSNTTSVEVDSNDGQAQTGWKMEYTSTTAAFVRLDATVSDQHLHSLAQLGLNNPAAIVYQLTTLTYVLDYFIGMGDWLQSLGATDGLTFYSGSYTRYGRYACILKSDERSQDVRFSGHGQWVKTERVPYLGFPFPIDPFVLKPEPLNLWQIGNIAALAISYLTGNPPKYMVA